jgi:cyclopropane-fatty-acyl-phospholipid synthase
MKKTSPEHLVPELLASAGVEINGNRPWDIQVHNSLFCKRVVTGGSIALGESYMDGWWDCDALDQFFDRILRFRLDQQAKKTIENPCGVPSKRHAPAHQTAFGPFASGEAITTSVTTCLSHMLDKWMNYSCAYWRGCR